MNILLKSYAVYCLLFFALSVHLYAQNASSYFQQETHYKINVTLDDRHHFLRGNISIQYINHSPDSLRFIYFHLWPNGFKDNNTAFAKQQLENGHTQFAYASDSFLGFIDSMNFLVDEVPARLEIDSVNIDVAKLFLSKSLAPGKSINITTPFRVKIPFTFSRLGHVGQQYQISQWYPKPAVYDRYGWHPMPNLDQGEFYSEFGSFDVRITLPKNYVVGATGILQTKSEQDWLQLKASHYQEEIDQANQPILNKKEKKKPLHLFPSSSNETKTIEYFAEDIHDFAWFADKRYLVATSSVKLPQSNRVVETMVLSLPENNSVWKNAAMFTDSSIYYFSKWIGDYPYPQMTVVEGALAAGDGMEYPMVTVITESTSPKLLDEVIAHEVGHNWFYGALGFNEREHPWMDEGITSYYENRYMKVRYPNSTLLPSELNLFSNLFDLHYPTNYQNYLFYLYSAAPRKDQSLNLPSTEYTELNYGAMLYYKTPIVFDYLESVIGTPKLDSIMSRFYSDWKFKHPYPGDLTQSIAQSSNKNFDWFNSQLLTTTDYADYKLVKEKSGYKVGSMDYAKLEVKNKQKVTGPFSIAAFKDGKKIAEQYYEGFSGKNVVQFPDGDFDYFSVDPEFNIPELNRNNNYLRRNGILKKTEKLRFQWLASIDNPNRTQIFFTPATGVNYYDGIMPGIAFYNSVFFPKKINVLLLPQYGIRSNNFVGLGSVAVPFYLKEGFIHTVTFTSAARSYTFDRTTIGTGDQLFDLRYMRFTQWLTLDLRKKYPRSTVNQKIIYRNIFLRQQEIRSVNDGSELPYENGMFNSIEYAYNDKRVINPLQFSFTTELGHPSDDTYVKVFGEGNFEVTYPRKKTGLGVRVFGGVFLKSPVINTYKFRLTATTGLDDYLFDDVFLGRSEETDVLAQQVSIADDGGFKMRTNGVSPRIGESSKWILSVSVKAPVFFFTPVFVFADGGFAPSDESSSFAEYDLFQYDAGIGITLVPRVVNIYFPIFYSRDIKDNLLDTDFYDHWYQRITFTFNIDRMNPFEIVRNIAL